MPTHANGDAIRRLREERGIPNYKLSAALGYNVSWLWKIENGKANGSAKAHKKLADYFGVTVADITRQVPRQRRRTRNATPSRQAA